ncbi:MAG: GNAT family N-acetyltransferase [Gemmatimonadales bacterium]
MLPCAPAQLVALIEQPERVSELSGFPLAPGLREFYGSSYLSPPWLAALREAAEPDPWRYGFFLVERDESLVIGVAGFKGPPDASGIVEIAYGIVPDHEGRGYATEAAEALVHFALAREEVRLVRAHTLPEANASTRVLEKCGFRSVGTVSDPEDGPVWRWERAR